jgi:serine/threonine protein kinase
LSEGAQAKIYLGLIEEIEKIVAIKRYIINHSEEEMDRIVEECEMVKNLEHPNIVKYFDVDISNVNYSDVDNGNLISRLDIIMEFLEGMNIKEYLIKNKVSDFPGIPMSNVKLIATKILEGLEYLHDNKIIHRDLKVKYILF